MGDIKVLNDDLINKIAAGEVIERPASVVKELIENSLDAGANAILVKIDNDCLDITVRDNGKGMDKDDAISCLLRHGTSKISDHRDLHKIRTFGFRGEALSSIASVSRLRLRTNDGKTGTEVVLEKNNPIIREIASPVGTTVIVKDLFYNTPARKKHLGKNELAKVIHIVTDFAIINPHRKIELENNGKSLLKSRRSRDIKSNVAGIWGAMIARNLISAEFAQKISLNGVISKAGYQLGAPSKQHLYINNRPVRSREIKEAIYKAYHTKLNIGMHPAFVLNLDIDPKIIDVNVHPRKEVVRIQDDYTDWITESLKSCLEQSEPERIKEISVSDVNKNLGDYEFSAEKQQEFKPKAQRSTFKILGQIMKTYVLAEGKDGLLIVDQHAAQERVLYEKYMEQFKNKSVAGQELIEPVVIELTPTEHMIVKKNLDYITYSGFAVEDFGGKSIILRSVPELFGRLQGRDVLMSIIDELVSGKNRILDKTKEERIIRKACRASIKANEVLESEQMISVLDELFLAKDPHTCPHGRPTMLKFSSTDMEKMFKRRL